MKTPIYKNILFWFIFLMFLIFSGWTAYSRQGGVVQIYKNATAPFDDEKRIDMVPPLPNNVVPVKTKYQGGRFWTETRKDKIERFTCSQCHNRSEVKVLKAAEIAHGEIVLDHGGEEKPLSCFTCHNKDERNYLVTEKGLKVDMDHSYRMCGKCHFRQHKDWVGGAHGKRLTYWAGPRVVQNCTSCHDPHSPLFKKRWPKTYSRPLSK
jgi:hypothetical protein